MVRLSYSFLWFLLVVLSTLDVLDLLQVLLLLVQLSLAFLVTEWISIVLLLLHYGRFEHVLLRVATPSCHHNLRLWIVLHSCFLSLFDPLFLSESLPFGQRFFFSQFKASWELNSSFWKTQEQFRLSKIMNLLFFR